MKCQRLPWGHREMCTETYLVNDVCYVCHFGGGTRRRAVTDIYAALLPPCKEQAHQTCVRVWIIGI